MKTPTKTNMTNHANTFHNKLSTNIKQSYSVTPLSTTSPTWKQSPKISTKKARLYLPPTCDTTNTNEIVYVLKRKESQTPKFNIQYKRLSSEDLSRMFPKPTNTLNSIRKHNLFLKYKNQSIKNNNTNTNVSASKQLQTINTISNETQQHNNNKTLKRAQSAIYTTNNTKPTNAFYPTHNDKAFKLSKDDKWKPTSYRDIELQLQNPKLIKNQFIFNIPSPQEIARYNNNSDIFNIQPSKPFVPPPQKHHTINNQKSDVFNLHCDSTNIHKSYETYMITSPTKYTTSKQSHSEWRDNVNSSSIINHPSTPFNILSPNKKNFVKSKSEYCLNNNNNNTGCSNSNSNTTFHRQKSICEISDISRNTNERINPTYFNEYQRNENTFKRKNDLCAIVRNQYHIVKHVISSPFL